MTRKTIVRPRPARNVFICGVFFILYRLRLASRSVNLFCSPFKDFPPTITFEARCSLKKIGFEFVRQVENSASLREKSLFLSSCVMNSYGNVPNWFFQQRNILTSFYREFKLPRGKIYEEGGILNFLCLISPLLLSR